MKIINNLKKILLTVILLVTAVMTISAQDKMASLAPSDVKMKAVDTLILHNLRHRENLQSPASTLYREWSNVSAHRYSDDVPETFVVNLKKFRMPTTSRTVTSNFGRRWGRMHKGIDVKVYIGDTICSAFDGKVRIVKYEPNGYGNYVVIRHTNGLETVYGHMSKHLVSENQVVKAGQPIGLGGNTGRSTGSHLHFETRLLGIAINPALMFDFVNQDVTADTYTFRRSEHLSEVANRRPAAKQQTAARQTVQASPVQLSPAVRQTTSAQQPAVRAAQPVPAKETVEVSANTTVSRATSHTVKRGDTLYSIATKNGMTVEQLCHKNGIPTSYNIKTGEVLKL